MTGNKFNPASFIDHTLLRPDATEAEIKRLCEEAKQYKFFSVCVHPYFLKPAKETLSESSVRLTTVVGFPLGITLSDIKIYEAMKCVSEGADELDIVINIGAAKSGKWDYIKRELSDLIIATKDATHKIIIETACLTDEEKIKASLSAMHAGAEFVKTSTGFAPKGALPGDVSLIKSATEGKIAIKAAGGIKTLNDMLALIEAGASRIGTSSGVSIIKELGYPLDSRIYTILCFVMII